MKVSLFNMKINYPPDFKPRYGYGSPQAKHLVSLFKSKESEQFEFLKTIAQYKNRFSAISVDAKENDPAPCWNQLWFPPLDGISMYTMVASNRPKTYLEIGSGNSTKFAAQAIHDYSLETEIISVDPQPRAEIDDICDRVVRRPLEDAPELEDIFLSLEPNDVVFFDGSHRCLQNSDVVAFFIDYLPVIPDGVRIGIHDIFWPNDYPEQWADRYYNEQYMLAAYMLGMGRRFPLIFSCAYMAGRYSDQVESCLDDALIASFHSLGKGVGGGALWFSKQMF